MYDFDYKVMGSKGIVIFVLTNLANMLTNFLISLAPTAPTEDTRLWLTGVMIGLFLGGWKMLTNYVNNNTTVAINPDAANPIAKAITSKWVK